MERKEEMLTHNPERLWLLNAISRLSFEFQDKIGCKIARVMKFEFVSHF